MTHVSYGFLENYL